MKTVHFLSICVLFSGMLASAQSNPVPLISEPLVPGTVAPAGSGFTLTVNGTGFVSGALVIWNGSTRPTSVLSSDTVQAQISAADVVSKGTAWVTVMNPRPGGGLSNVVFFCIRNSAEGLGFARKDTTISNGSWAAVGDFNNDRKLDVATSSGTNIQVWLGNGDGTFRTPITTARKNWMVGSMVAGDFNGDGKLDLAVSENLVANRNNIHVAILLGRGDGTFTHSKAQTIRENAFPVSVLDYDGDGNLDLATTGRQSFVEIWHGNGDGTFTLLHVVGQYGSPAFGDFDGDGKIDVAAIRSARAIEVITSGGKVNEYQVALYASHLAAVDVNGDGRVDLVTDGVSVLLGNGDGTFKDAGGTLSQEFGASVNVGDFNGDGKLDISAGSSVLLGNGDGTFQNPLLFAETGQIFGMGDFNGDGKLDLLSVNPTTLSVLVQIRVYLTPPSLNFGSQDVGTTSPPQPATLTNFIPGSSLAITKIKIIGADSADFAQTNNCGKSLPPNGSCQIQVTFTPSRGGAENASLSAGFKDAGSPLTASLSGFGVVVTNTVTLTPSSLTYPTQLLGTTSPSQGATLTNTGTQPVNISNIAAIAPFSQTNNCPSILPVSGSCGIQVTFTPTDPGLVNGTLSVTDDAQGSPQKVTLSGTGTEVVLSPISINFGDQKVGSASPSVPISLTNISKGSLSITKIAIKGTNAGDFAQTNNCGTSVPPQGHCTINVTFTPTAKGQRSATVSISDDGGDSPQTVPLLGTGT